MKLITSKEQSTEAAIFLLNRYYGNLKEYRMEKYPNTIFYYRPSDKKIIMEQDLKNGDLWVSYKEIWSFLETSFLYNYDETQEVIKIWVEEAYNLKGVTPGCLLADTAGLVEEAYNLKGVTPGVIFNPAQVTVEEAYNLKGVTPDLVRRTHLIRVEESYNLNKNKK